VETEAWDDRFRSAERKKVGGAVFPGEWPLGVDEKRTRKGGGPWKDLSGGKGGRVILWSD